MDEYLLKSLTIFFLLILIFALISALFFFKTIALTFWKRAGIILCIFSLFFPLFHVPEQKPFIPSKIFEEKVIQKEILECPNLDVEGFLAVKTGFECLNGVLNQIFNSINQYFISHFEEKETRFSEGYSVSLVLLFFGIFHVFIGGFAAKLGLFMLFSSFRFYFLFCCFKSSYSFSC
ncbi:hypothetical protein M0811_11677 [Anaeramoeba ignava]|uniref:Uncharacterized protein n=1 Tax=Anaeramoeba ignava TaxID=1746090 RepID=A0A9Q0LBH4_ANAIG|nr:hypothetical protein M0811_11677 [Anaeramoeba ignava]